MSPSGTKVAVDIEGRRLGLSNLEKVLWPETHFTKGLVLDYYTRVSPVLLPHLHGRPLTLKRFPDGVEGGSFYEKNAPRGTPEWVRRERLPTPGSSKDRETIDFVVVDELATLVWAANLASLELHTPMWRVAEPGSWRGGDPDLVVFDLDPGPPATVVECCEVALLLREVLVADGLQPVAKTSGSKGLQLYAAVSGSTSRGTSDYARALAERFERSHPDLVVSRMTKALRPGKVLVDWSQNNAAKTTVSVYSLRARARHTVSTPVTWDEVEACAAPEDLAFLAEEVLERVEEHGDLFAALLDPGPSLPGR
ncbi:MAG: non-homologous end-joining DNA ligase [Actinomycetota bacterium]|nr:non-homologous end-joining DNA ligase [Actinomycetota bacterium]